MTNHRDETFELNGQTFRIVINQPKAKRQYRGYLTNHTTLELGSGRWDTIEQAEAALRAMAHKIAFGAPPPADR